MTEKIEEKYIELLQQEIDKRNSPDESAQLQQYLQTNAAARQLYNDLLNVTSVMSRAHDVEPPSSLTASIMASIPQPRKEQSSTFFFFRQIAEFVESRTSFQYAYVFAAGLIVGVALYSLVAVHPSTSSSIDPQTLSGTILIGASTTPLTVGESFQVQNEQAGVSVVGQTKFSKNLATIDFTLHSNHPVNIVVSFDPKNLAFTGYSQSPDARGERTVSNGVFQITTQGENHYSLTFERTSADPSGINIRAQDSGQIVFEKNVTLGIAESDAKNR